MYESVAQVRVSISRTPTLISMLGSCNSKFAELVD